MKTLRLALIAVLAACSTDNPVPQGSKYEHADAKSAAATIAAGDVVVLDVRTPGEFAAGHIKGAILVDYMASDFAAKLGELDRTKTYVVHCRSGGRSTNSLDTLKELGFQHVIHLDGGMLAWQKAGLPVEK